MESQAPNSTENQANCSFLPGYPWRRKKYLNSRHYFWIWESTLAMNRSKREVDVFKIRTKYKVLEKEMATYFSILAWRMPWTEEPGRLQSMGSQQSDTTEWLTCMQSLVDTFAEIQIVSSLGGEYCQHRNKGSKAPKARTFWEKLFPRPSLIPTWPWKIIACPVHPESQETAKLSGTAQKW